MPKFTVIIPVYNSEKYIAQSLDSIINQSLKDIEIICIDDGSTDNSKKIIENYIEKDKRMKLISQPNLHAGIARNNGLNIANGQYIHFMDSDDILINDYVYEKLYSVVEKQKYPNIIKFKNKAFDNDTNEYIPNDRYELKIIDEKYINDFIYVEKDLKNIFKLTVTPWSAIYNREFLLKSNIKFNDNICCNDRSFFTLTMLEAQKCYIADLFVVNHRKRLNSLIQIRDKHFDCHFKSINIIKKYLEENISNEYIKKMVFINELRDLFYFYNKIEQVSKYKDKVYKQTIDFVKNINIENLEPELSSEFFYNTIIEFKNKS